MQIEELNLNIIAGETSHVRYLNLNLAKYAKVNCDGPKIVLLASDCRKLALTVSVLDFIMQSFSTTIDMTPLLSPQ